MRLGGFARVHEAVRREKVIAKPNVHGRDHELSHAVDLACVFYFKPVLCLQRSAALALLLRRHGIEAEMVIGAQLLPFLSPRLVMSMYRLHRLPGQGANPSGAPTKHSGTEQRTEEPWDGVLKSSRHHADASEDQTTETNDGARIDRERFERPHEGLSPGEIHRSLSVRNSREGKDEKDGRHGANMVREWAALNPTTKLESASARHWHLHRL